MSAKPDSFTILDGGMGRLLERLGAPFRLPEWSALALIEAPNTVIRAHRLYVESGAEIITANSYGVVPHMIGEERFAAAGLALAARAGSLARAATDEAGRAVRVAGSLPPLFGSYRPSGFQPRRAPSILKVLVEGLAPDVDLWLIETQSSTAEAFAAIEAVRPTGLPYWVSYTLRDDDGREGPPELRSGEPVGEAVARTLDKGVQSILFNCSQPEAMSGAIKAAHAAILASARRRIGLGVYANAFVPEPPSEAPYAGISKIREDVDPENYVRWVQRWVGLGATVVGSCCGVGPEHIDAIRRSRRS